MTLPNSNSVGRIITLLVGYDIAGNLMQDSQNIPAPGNCFYVVDSPYPLTIRTDISPNSTYWEQTGQAFPREIGSLSVKLSEAVPGIFPNQPAVFQVRMWVGPSSFYGFIDKRPLVPANSCEMICGLVDRTVGGFTLSDGVFFLPALTTTVQIPITPISNEFVQFSQIDSVMISNESTLGILRVQDGYGTNNAVCSLFPYQTFRIPFGFKTATPTGSTIIELPNPKGTVYLNFSNATANDITGTLGVVLRYNQNFAQRYSFPNV